MYDPEMRKDCPMRGNLGNCSPVGGFCMNAVSDEICEAVHNAYYKGWMDSYDHIMKQLKIIRCKDCEYRHDSLRCQMYSEGMDTPDDWFCADGKRRDDDDDD